MLCVRGYAQLVKTKWKSITFVLVFFFAALMNSLSADAATVDELKSNWNVTRYYPIYEGSPEWQKHSMEDTLEANNPPYELLFDMSSAELATLLFEYPAMPQMTTYYGEDGGVDYTQFCMFLELKSDIFYELLRREDGMTAILTTYQNSGVDAQWFADEVYDQSDADQRKWYAEVFGSQFIRMYAKVFTEEEAALAKHVIQEKNEIYSKADNASPEYFAISDIENGDSHSTAQVRALFLSQDQIAEREAAFREAAASIPSEEESREQEVIAETPGKSKKPIGFIVSGCIFAAAVLTLGVVWLRRKKRTS